MEWLRNRSSALSDYWRPVALICVFFLVALTVVHAVGDYTVTDFFTFWLAGRMTLQGQDVYSATLWQAGHQYYGSTWMPNPFFPYPITLSLFLVPLGLLPLKFAYLSWVFATQVLLTLSIFLLTASWKGSEWANLRYLLVISMFPFRPVLVTLFSAQLVAFFLLVSSLAVYFWKQGRWFLGGMIISLLT